MNPFFNDDDLKGNRRSVLIASSIVFALYFAEFRSDEISLFGLRVVVSQTSIIIGVKFVLLYLISVFCLGVFGYVTQLERDRILDVGRELEQRYDLWKTAIRKATKHLDNANKDQPLGATEYLSSMDRGIRRVASLRYLYEEKLSARTTWAKRIERIRQFGIPHSPSNSLIFLS